MKTINITLPDATARLVELLFIPALEGWDIQRDYERFRFSTDKEFRTAFTMRVLAYCKVYNGSTQIPLSTSALIDNHLGKWENIRDVFNAILQHNGIDPETHGDRPDYWREVGSSIAVAFLAECQQLLGPAMQIATDIKG